MKYDLWVNTLLGSLALHTSHQILIFRRPILDYDDDDRDDDDDDDDIDDDESNIYQEDDNGASRPLEN